MHCGSYGAALTHRFLPDRSTAVQLEVDTNSDAGVYVISVPTVIADRAWHHVAVTRDADGGTRLIVDGVSSHTNTADTGLTWTTGMEDDLTSSAGAQIAIGGPLLVPHDAFPSSSPSPSPEFSEAELFTGFIAEVRAWNGSVATAALVNVLSARARFEAAETIVRSAGATAAVPFGGIAESASGVPLGLLGSWPLTAATGLADVSGSVVGQPLLQNTTTIPNTAASGRFLPTAIGSLAEDQDHMDPTALRVTCNTRADEVSFLKDNRTSTATYLVQCPKELCNDTVDDATVTLALTNGGSRLPTGVPICYGARQRNLVSESNQANDFTILQLEYGVATVNFTGVNETQEYVRMSVPILVRGRSVRLVEADQAISSVEISVSLGHQPLCEGLLNVDNGICYNFTGTMMKWTDAWDHCAAWGGTPAIARSAADFLFMRRQFSVYNLSNLAWLGGVSLDPDAELLVASIDSGSYIQNPDSPATDEVNPYEYAILSDWRESVLAETELSVICEKIESYYITLYSPLGGPGFTMPQFVEITSVFWDLWYPVTVYMEQDSIYQGPRSFSVLMELTCSNCNDRILSPVSITFAIDGEDEEIFVDVVGGSLEQHLLPETADQVPLWVSLPSNFRIECPTGYYSLITGSCYSLMYATTWAAATTTCADDFDPDLSDLTPKLALVDVANEEQDLKLIAAVLGGTLLYAFLQNTIVAAVDPATVATGLDGVNAWKTYFNNDIYKPVSGGHPFICERRGQLAIDIVDGWDGAIAPQMLPDPARITFTTSDWHLNQTTHTVAVEDVVQEPYLQITTYEITVDADSKVDHVWHNQFANEDMKILDNDVADAVMTPIVWAVTADGNSSFGVKLVTEPTHPVTVHVGLRDPAAVAGDTYEPFVLHPTALVFTASNWMLEQTVTLTAGVRTDYTNRTYLGEVDDATGRNNSIFPDRFTIQDPWPDITTVIQYTFSSEDQFYNSTRLVLLRDEWSADGYGNMFLPRWQAQKGCAIGSLGVCNTEAPPLPVDPYDAATFSRAMWFYGTFAGVDPTPDALEGIYASPLETPLAIAAPAYDHEMVTIEVAAASGGVIALAIEWGLPPDVTDPNCSSVFPKVAHPCSATDCTTSTLGNGRCNPNNNVCGCDWDAGDCCGDGGQANQYTLCVTNADGTCCKDPDEPARGEVVVEYLIRGRDMEWSAKDSKFLDTWRTLDSIVVDLNTTAADLKTDGIGPTKLVLDVPAFYQLPCTPSTGCFGELGCDNSCPAAQVTTFRVRQGVSHDTRIGWAVWDFRFEASRDTHLTVVENQLVVTEYNLTQDQCTIWRCSPDDGVAECPMAPGMNLSRLEPAGCGWKEVEVVDAERTYDRPERCNEDSFYCEFMTFVSEDGTHDAHFDVGLHALPPTSPVTLHLWADPEAHRRELNDLRQIAVSPTQIVFDDTNYTQTVRVNITALDDEWFEDLHWANIHINVTAAQESFRRLEHWLWVAVVDDERPEIIIEPTSALVYETDGGLYNQPVIDLDFEDGTAVYYAYLLSRPRRQYVDVYVHINNTQVTTNVSVVRFTQDNWDVPQGILVTAINDWVDESHAFFEGRRFFNITHTSDSDDEFYNNLRVSSVEVTVVDDDNAELLVSRQVLAFEYSSQDDSYSVGLQSEPAFTVHFNLTTPKWADFEIVPSVFSIEPEDWRVPVVVNTSGAGTDWTVGGLISFLTGTQNDGSPLAEPEGSRAFNLVHNLTSRDPNYHWVSNIENEFNYTQPANERIGVIEPLPPLLEEGYQMNRYSIALQFPPVANVTVTCSAPAAQAELSHWWCTNCDNISLVQWQSVRGASIDLLFDVDNWNVEKVVWVEALDDNVLEYNHTITINHTAQSIDAIYDSDLAPLPCVFSICGEYDWSSALFWETRQGTAGFDLAFRLRIDDITFNVIDRAAAILTFEEVPPMLLADTAGDDDGDGTNDDVNRFDRVSYAPLEEDSHLVVAEGARAVSYNIHLTQPPKVRSDEESVVELRMSASDCDGRLLFNITSPEYNQTWATDVYEEKTFSLFFTRDTYSIPHNVTVTLLQDLQHHATQTCTLVTISAAQDQLFSTDRSDHQYRWQDPRGIIWFAPQISRFAFNGDLSVTMLDDDPSWMDQGFYRQLGIALSMITAGVLVILVLADLAESPTGNLLSVALVLQQLVLTGDLVRDMTDVYVSFSDTFSWALIRRSTALEDLDDFTTWLTLFLDEGTVLSIGPFFLETWLGCGALLAVAFVVRGTCWFLVTFYRFARFSRPTTHQREAHAKSEARKKQARFKREKAAAMRRIARQMKKKEEIEQKKQDAEARAALVLEEDAKRKQLNNNGGKKSRIVPVGLLDDIPDASDSDDDGSGGGGGGGGGGGATTNKPRDGRSKRAVRPSALGLTTAQLQARKAIRDRLLQEQLQPAGSFGLAPRGSHVFSTGNGSADYLGFILSLIHI